MVPFEILYIIVYLYIYPLVITFADPDILELPQSIASPILASAKPFTNTLGLPDDCPPPWSGQTAQP
jgi:hypothetical protein